MMTEEQKQALIQYAIKFKSARNVYGSDIQEIRSLADFALAALTQPASQDFKLPNGWVAVPREATIEMIESGWTYSVLEKNATAKGTWACMVAAAPAVPHTAPIEPKGGAEWFKCSDRMPNGEVEVLLCMKGGFVLNAVYVYDKDDDDFRDYQDIWDPVNASLISHWTEKPAAPEEK